MTQEIIIVSGLPRSGTSVMMQMLESGGVEVVTDGVRSADTDNPRGYYEFEQVKTIQHDASWLPAMRGKAFKMVSQLLYDLPASETYRIVFMERDLDETLLSQEKMLTRLGPRGGPARGDEAGLTRCTWSGCTSGSRCQANMAVLRVSYNDLVERPREQAERVARVPRRHGGRRADGEDGGPVALSEQEERRCIDRGAAGVNDSGIARNERTTCQAASCPSHHSPGKCRTRPCRPDGPVWCCRHVPALDSLRRYSWRTLGGDLTAGLTVATVAVPQAMAYAILAGLPPQYGLYTAIVMTAVGALLDSSRQLINGPTNAISIALLSALAVVPESGTRVGRRAARLPGGGRAAGHRPPAAGRPDPLRLAQRHRRLHRWRGQPPRPGPDEEPPRPGGARRPRGPLPQAILAVADERRRRPLADAPDRRGDHRPRGGRAAAQRLAAPPRRPLPHPAAPRRRRPHGGPRLGLSAGRGLRREDRRRHPGLPAALPAAGPEVGPDAVCWPATPSPSRSWACWRRWPWPRPSPPAPARSSTSTSSASARGRPTWPAASSSASPARGR